VYYYYYYYLFIFLYFWGGVESVQESHKQLCRCGRLLRTK